MARRQYRGDPKGPFRPPTYITEAWAELNLNGEQSDSDTDIDTDQNDPRDTTMSTDEPTETETTADAEASGTTTEQTTTTGRTIGGTTDDDLHDERTVTLPAGVDPDDLKPYERDVLTASACVPDDRPLASDIAERDDVGVSHAMVRNVLRRYVYDDEFGDLSDQTQDAIRAAAKFPNGSAGAVARFVDASRSTVSNARYSYPDIIADIQEQAGDDEIDRRPFDQNPHSDVLHVDEVLDEYGFHDDADGVNEATDDGVDGGDGDDGTSRTLDEIRGAYTGNYGAIRFGSSDKYHYVGADGDVICPNSFDDADGTETDVETAERFFELCSNCQAAAKDDWNMTTDDLRTEIATELDVDYGGDGPFDDDTLKAILKGAVGR